MDYFFCPTVLLMLYSRFRWRCWVIAVVLMSRGTNKVENHWHSGLDLNSKVWTFEKNFKRTINCPLTRVNINEPSMQRTNWPCDWSVTSVPSESRNCAMPPDHLRSEMSFSCICNIPNFIYIYIYIYSISHGSHTV